MVTSAEGFVPVMVPVVLVAEVMLLTGRRMREMDGAEPESERTDDTTVAEGASGSDDRVRDWDDQLIERSWAESPRSMKLVLPYLAEHADEWITTVDLARVAYPDSGDRKKLAGALGAFGHRCSSRYGVKTWPFEAVWNYDIGMQEYSMEQRFADLYRKYFD